MKKYESFVRCLSVLEQAERNLATPNKIYYMEVITQFNLIFELAWKALKEMLNLYGVTEVATGSPRKIFTAAYKLGWLKNEKTGWICSSSEKAVDGCLLRIG